MKNVKRIIVIVVFCFAFVYAGNYNVQASQKVLYDSEKGLNQTKLIDITGDGKKDTIKFHSKMKCVDWIDTFSISVNGKKAFSANKKYDFIYRVTYLRQSSKNIFLYIESHGNNYDSAVSAVYKYDRKTKKLVKVLTLESQEENSTQWLGATHIGSVVSINKGKLKVTYDGQLDAFGQVKWTKTYTYNGKKFVEDRAAVAATGKKYYMPLFPKAGEVPVFEDLKGTQFFKLVPGKKVKILKVCKYKKAGTYGYYVLVSQGTKTGWIWSGYTDIFKNVLLCG